MTIEHVLLQNEIEEIKELAKAEVLQKLEDVSNWKLEYPWSETDNVSIISKDENSKYRIFMDEEILTIGLRYENLIIEEFPRRKRFFSWFTKNPESKSVLRQKIENLDSFLKEKYKTKKLQENLENIKEIYQGK